MSQLEPDDASRLWQCFRVDWDFDAEPARLLVRPEDGTDVRVLGSLPWPPDVRPPDRPVNDVAMPAESATGQVLRQAAFVQTSFDSREFYYVMMPLWERFGDVRPDGWRSDVSDARSLLTLLMGDADDDDRLRLERLNPNMYAFFVESDAATTWS